MDIYELLARDHQRAIDLFAHVLDTRREQLRLRERTFDALKRELKIHAAMEEQAFYSILREFDETRELILEADERHRIVDRLLEELTTMDKSTEQWWAKLRILRDNVAYHVEEEESELFEKAREVLTLGDAKQLGEHAREIQRQLH